MITGIIFDVDGVLLDSMGIWNDLSSEYLRKRGIMPEEGLDKKLFSMSMEQGAQYLKVHYHLPDTEREILDGIEEIMRDFYFYEVKLKPGVKELISFLTDRKVPAALATSSPREHVMRALERNGILEYFNGNLFTTGEVGHSKHDPDIYLLAASALHSACNSTAVFEDSLYALTTAKDAGFIPIGIFDSGEPDQNGLKQCAEVYLTDIADFIKYRDVIKIKRYPEL